MTHFNQAIRFLQNTKPKSKADRQAKRKALRILYNAEAKEKPKTRSKSVKRQSKKQPDSITGFIGFLGKSASNKINAHLERSKQLHDTEKRINQQKENAGYKHIEPKATRRQALAEINTGLKFEPEKPANPEALIPKQDLRQSNA